MKNVAIILAGGKGSRFGADIPKQFIKARGRSILAYTIECFENHDEIDSIEIVYRSGYLDAIKDICEKERFSKVKWFTEGSEEFYYSAERGILNLANEISDDDQILIHYGVSPMTSNKIISDAINVCKRHGNAIASRKQVYLVAGRGDGKSTTHHINREDVMLINSPQALNFKFACNLINEIRNKKMLKVTEPYLTSLMLELGHEIWFSYDSTDNIKITTKEDLKLFEGWLNQS